MQTPAHKLGAYLLVALLLAFGLAACDQKFGADRVALGTCGGAQAQPITTALDGDDESPPPKTAVDAATQQSDLALLINVKSALLSAPELKTFPIDVGVLRGVVTLYGVVDTPAHREQAAQVAQNIDGVQTVKSGIAVIRAS